QENQDRAPARQPEQTTPDASTELEVLPRTTVEATPIARLTDICIVSLKEGRKAHTDKQFRAEYRGRVYYFSSAEALGKFERSPEEYAVAFGGCDPVTFVASQKITEGRYLVSHEGRFYMFSSQENYEKFKAAPGIYSGQTKDADWVASR
ncbi:MAG: YHS domain-containing protein, partial [Planctomycetaceae bacterium]|nr:YHS domain-containing protein [Planctomycetaceae bacterium]